MRAPMSRSFAASTLRMVAKEGDMVPKVTFKVNAMFSMKVAIPSNILFSLFPLEGSRSRRENWWFKPFHLEGCYI